jgi:hypothetical protein
LDFDKGQTGRIQPEIYDASSNEVTLTPVGCNLVALPYPDPVQVPESLTSEQKLYYVVGVVTKYATQTEDAVDSLLRALNGDFSLAVGQPQTPRLSDQLKDCEKLLNSDERLVEIREAARNLLGRVKVAARERDRLVHSLWVQLETDGPPAYSTINDYANGQPTAPIESLASSADGLEKVQRSLNILKFLLVDVLNRHGQLPTSDSQLWTAIVRGEFDLVGGGIRMHDRKLAAHASGE